MSSQSKAGLLRGAGANAWPQSTNRDIAEEQGVGQLEVNVIFTDPAATAVALHYAASLARGLSGRISLRAPLVVPLRLSLDESPVSVRFMERRLSDLVYRLGEDAAGATVHLYLCRDRLEALLEVLSPDSLVVIGGRKRWWATEESRIAKALRSKGHRVVFVSVGKCLPPFWKKFSFGRLFRWKEPSGLKQEVGLRRAVGLRQEVGLKQAVGSKQAFGSKQEDRGDRQQR
jgi:hypothetical protein